MREINPSTRAITFGWIESRKLFKNVYAEDDGKIKVKYKSYPANDMADSILQNTNHGIITEYSNGFSVSGINKNQKFECPSGYTTPDCKLESMCEPKDVRKMKIINNSLFNLLNLYNYKTPINGEISTHQYHPKLRVKCLNSQGDYTIDPCKKTNWYNWNKTSNPCAK